MGWAALQWRHYLGDPPAHGCVGIFDVCIAMQGVCRKYVLGAPPLPALSGLGISLLSYATVSLLFLFLCVGQALQVNPLASAVCCIDALCCRYNAVTALRRGRMVILCPCQRTSTDLIYAEIQHWVSGGDLHLERASWCMVAMLGSLLGEQL